MTIPSSRFILPFLLTFLFSSFIQSQDNSIFLCIDSMMTLKKTTNREPQKLVYTYLKGKRTECMSEHELHALISKESFKEKDQEIQNKQKKTLQQNSVFRGEKNLQNFDLRGIDLQGVDLSGADLSGALLESADLRNANLSNAHLNHANLKNTYCKSTSFKNADLSDADLSGAFFQNSDLSGAEGLTIENLKFTSTLFKAKIDSALSEEVEQSLSSKLQQPKGTWVPNFIEHESVGDSLSR